MAGAQFVANASIFGVVILEGAFPGLVPGDSIIHGELFQVPPALWASLDQYEGLDYMRRLSDVHVDGAAVSAWVYWLR